mmetsp:Transcript_15254/g.22270  ORF Transcript_15254/g.22270 Transcript_15254/m.22270 type:complete len:107 (+) Transcript_15254:936-1256(+)
MPSPLTTALSLSSKPLSTQDDILQHATPSLSTLTISTPAAPLALVSFIRLPSPQKNQHHSYQCILKHRNIHPLTIVWQYQCHLFIQHPITILVLLPFLTSCLLYPL